MASAPKWKDKLVKTKSWYQSLWYTKFSYLFRFGGNVRALNLIIFPLSFKLSKEISILIKKVKFTTYGSLKQSNLKLKHSVFFFNVLCSGWEQIYISCKTRASRPKSFHLIGSLWLSCWLTSCLARKQEYCFKLN